MRHRPRLVFLAVLTILCWFSMSAAAFAGDGSGGGPNSPLALVSTSASSTEIKLTFNKNVVSDTVKDKNKACFTLTDASGESFPFQVSMAGDQPGSDSSRTITLQLQKEFAPGTTYTLKISPELQAKNGATVGKTITIRLSATNDSPLKVTTGSPVYSGGGPASSVSNSYVVPGAIVVAVGGVGAIIAARRKKKI